MNYHVTSEPLESIKADALVVLLTEDGPLGRSSVVHLQEHIDSFHKAVAAKTSNAEWFCTLEKACPAPARHLLLDSATFGRKLPGNERLKVAAARCIETCRAYSITKLAFAVQGNRAAENARAIFEGIYLGDFLDQRFKSMPASRPALEITFVTDQDQANAVEKTLSRTQIVVRAQNLARELVNQPNNSLTPSAFVDLAQQFSDQHSSIECEVLDQDQLEQQGYGLICGVGKGSIHPPHLIILRYQPEHSSSAKNPNVYLLGKGVCFDTGGYCIKGSKGMHTMNADMAGGAAVFGIMQAVSELKPNINITAIIPAVVNGVDGAAMMPGCILTSKNGKTVYIENTDAEGRLILADAIARSSEEGIQPGDYLVDFATLTGAAGAALGERIGALFSNSEELQTQFMSASTRTGDHLWPLPLWEEYEQNLNHPLADLNNISSAVPYGGAIHAANFLKAFLPKDIRWAHIDMSRAARSNGKARYFNDGGTGFGVRLMVDVLSQLEGNSVTV